MTFEAGHETYRRYLDSRKSSEIMESGLNWKRRTVRSRTFVKLTIKITLEKDVSEL